MDAATTPGEWRYSLAMAGIGRTSRAMFMTPGGETVFEVACLAGDSIALSRSVQSVQNLEMTVRTETATVTRLAPPDPEGMPVVKAVVQPQDPLLDAMALSKGRFAVEVEGQPTLYLPSYAEVSRVIEDCR